MLDNAIYHRLTVTELEDLLLSNPNIEDAAVIGVWDNEQTTEIPKAYGQRFENFVAYYVT